jgi:hypothetical protein
LIGSFRVAVVTIPLGMSPGPNFSSGLLGEG